MASNQGWKKWAKRLGIGIVVLYLLICGVMYFAQDYLLFHPTVLAADAAWDLSIPDSKGLESAVEELNFPSDLEGKVNALHFKLDSAHGVVMYLHGNGGNAGICARNRNPFLQRGWEFFIPDYRGYGKSTGPLSQEGIDADMEAAWIELTKKYPAKRIIIYGQSLGSGFATRLAAKHTPRLLILETPYTSLREVAQWQYPWLPVGLLMRYPSEALTAMQSLQCPAYVIHGTGDETIPYAMGEQMSGAANKSQLFTCPGVGHNGCRKSAEFDQLLDQALR